MPNKRYDWQLPPLPNLLLTEASTSGGEEKATIAALVGSAGIIFIFSVVLGEICTRLKLPTVLGDLVAGMLLGGSVLGLLVFPSEGEYVNSGQELTTLTSNRNLEVRFSVPAQKATQLRLGLPVELRIDKQANQPLVRGRISFIAPEANSATQAITAKATFPNPNGKLRSDQFVRVKIIWDRSPAVLVPTVAVSRIGNQAFVFVAENEKNTESGEIQKVAKQRPIKLGQIQGNSYQVIEGLKAGETIVTTGILNLSDGAAIAPEESEEKNNS